jgi:hydrogenase/urease accessory protein HupE
MQRHRTTVATTLITNPGLTAGSGFSAAAGVVKLGSPMIAIRVILGLVLCAQVLYAHDPGLSTATMTVRAERIDVVLGFARKDVESMLSDRLTQVSIDTSERFRSIQSRLESLLSERIALYLDKQRIQPVQVAAQQKDDNNIEMLLCYQRTNAVRLRLLSALLETLPFGHREFLSVHAADGSILGEAMLSAKDNSFQTDLPAITLSTATQSNRHSFLGFLKLGVEHILTGYDHLLFLFALMVVCRDLRSILTVITCFTIAHSITLGLATFDIVRLPGRIMEPLIAASIAYVGMENLVRGDSPKGRTLIAFSFGLVHGLGFADALQELGITSSQFGIVVPLVGFNLGVEVGQLSVAAIVLPILWQLRRNPSFVRRWVPVCSVAVALVGSYWMVERIMQK